MSIKLMAAAWELPIPATEKMVLLCLCDYANDEGTNCFPAIATIARKCSKGARTVQMAIRWLCEHEILALNDSPGKTHNFALNPRKICTPAEIAPPQKLRHGGAKVAPLPPQNLRPNHHRKHQLTTKNNTRAEKIGKPDGVSDQCWQDFLAHRKRKRADLTATALARIASEAAKADWALEDALAEIVARGWQGFKAEWVKDGNNGNGSKANRGLPADNRDGIARALDRRLAAGYAAGEA